MNHDTPTVEVVPDEMACAMIAADVHQLMKRAGKGELEITQASAESIWQIYRSAQILWNLVR